MSKDMIYLSAAKSFYSGEEKKEVERLMSIFGDAYVSKEFIEDDLVRTCLPGKEYTFCPDDKKTYRHFVGKTKFVSLKDTLSIFRDERRDKIERLYSILGDVVLPVEFIFGYLSYFYHYSSRRRDLAFTEESLKGMYDLCITCPSLRSDSIKLIMGEYVKDMFDKVKPLKYFDGMTLDEMDSSFDKFMTYLKEEGDKSDIPYKEQESLIEERFESYGSAFIKLMKECSVKYHKSCDELDYSVPTSTVVRKDADVFYKIGSKELFGPSGYPYSFKMCKSMILFGDTGGYEDPLMYDSTIMGRFKSEMTADEFTNSIEVKRQIIDYMKKK